MGRHKKTKDAPTLRSPEEVERLVNENIGLVHHFKLKYASWHPDEAELLSTAMRGLHRAAQTWNPAKGIPFGTYASMRIKWYLMRLIHPPASQRRGVGATFYSLDCEALDGRQWHELLEDEGAVREPVSDAVEQAVASLGRLDSRDQRLLRLRFGLEDGEPRTLEQIAAAIGVTRERVRQLEAKALAHLTCIVRGIPFRWDYKRHRCPTLNGQAPVSVAATHSKWERSIKENKLRKSR